MKLSSRIISRISLALLLLFALWASLFYFIIIEEINDETDDALEDYSEYIITRALAGETLPSADNGSNNSYHITEITPEYADRNPAISYRSEMIYLHSKKETEPARILKTIFRDAGDRYRELTVSIPTIEKEDLQEVILWWIIVLYISLLILIIVVNLWILHNSFKPLYAILKWLDDFGVEKEVTPLDNPTRITEFGKLNSAVMRAAQRNTDTYKQQKSFIEHASHELQTPLAVSLNKLELLADDPELNERQLGEIDKITQSLNQMVKLNKTLLLMTKIENNQFPDKKEVAVNDLIKKLIADCLEVYAQRNISLLLNEDAVLKISMNETLASILFGNLLKNACLHNRQNGIIRIRISSLSFTVANTGIPEMLDEASIFNRFYCGIKKEDSTGLGLSLCQSVCRLYGIEIRYAFINREHSFSLLFPTLR
ncbi:MAG: HAMP domain-containing histidine kinase [Prevotellaceae bacterium]|jgi:signal transduction histidine kinase|nr:HAMP domain-containing histidine kinase [Prevotellaceae bacterium]